MKLWAPGHGVPEVLAGSKAGWCGQGTGMGEFRESPSTLYCFMSGQRPHPLLPALVSGDALGFNRAGEEKPDPQQPAGGSQGKVMCHAHTYPALNAQPGLGLKPPALWPRITRACLSQCWEESVEEPGSPDPSPSIAMLSLPDPMAPSLWNQRHRMGSPRWDNHPDASRAAQGAGNGACLLSIPKPGYAVWVFFPLH